MVSGLFKWLLISVLWVHPFYVSVTEINHNAKDKTLEISCKMFSEDLEKVLEKDYKQKVDLSDEKLHDTNNNLIDDYLHKHLRVKVDGKEAVLKLIGFEKESEAVWGYLQADNIATAKKVEITNSILHDFTEDQINLVHVIVGGKRKSTKLDYPATAAVFEF